MEEPLSVDGRIPVRTALVVHGSADARHAIARRLRRIPLTVLEAVDAFDAELRMAEARPDVVVADLGTPSEEGLALVGRVREWSDVPVVILATVPSQSAGRRAMRAGAQRYLVWTEDLADLAPAVASVLGRRSEGASPRAVDLASARARREEQRSELGRLLRECDGDIGRVAAQLRRDRDTVLFHLKRLALFPAASAR